VSFCTDATPNVVEHGQQSTVQKWIADAPSLSFL
jgi:hypothetical protein